jgi:hypothetical protein
MYLTAQHVRSHKGEEEVHVYLHVHGADAAALKDPLSVPQSNPGRLVKDSVRRQIPPGGNTVIAYLDIVADDVIGAGAHLEASAHPQPWWQAALESVGKTMSGEPTPWVVDVAGVHVIFSATPIPSVTEEYERLLAAAVARWARWRKQGAAHGS